MKIKNKMDVLKNKANKICKKVQERKFICKFESFNAFHCELYDVHDGDLLLKYVKSVCHKYTKQFK